MNRIRFRTIESQDLNDLFNKACTYFASIANKSDNRELLMFYSLYKQSVVGPCNTLRPGFFDFTAKQKWDAWKDLKCMTKDEAMERYISKLTECSPCWEEETTHMKSGWSSVSRMLPGKDINEDEKTLFHFVQENNITKIMEFDSLNLKMSDENEMTALHWSCDRGFLEISQYLIAHHLDVNKQATDGQTPLHYAASCGHEKVVRLLLSNGAKTNLVDSDGCLPRDIAENKDIKDLLKHSSV